MRKTQKAIGQRLVEINKNRADMLAGEINNTDDARKMFEATRSLAGFKKTTSIVGHDKNNAVIATDLGKAAEAKEFFEN